MMHDSRLVLPASSDLYERFATWATASKMVFFAGLPGVGKSLYLQQLALLAQNAGRNVHLLQWDSSRLAIERPPYSDRYPEDDGATHPVIRKAVGVWARQAVVDWAKGYAGKDDILIGEVPLAGNRLIELVRPEADSAEKILAAPNTIFCTPVPSNRVRAHIESARQASIANPRHEREKHDAQPNVMYETWYELNRCALEVGTSTLQGSKPDYSADVYADTFAHLLRYRNGVILRVDSLLEPAGSVYDLDNIAGELAATESEAAAIVARLDGMQSAEIIAQVHNWYRF